MTAQMCETLLYAEQRLAMESLPLEDYLATLPRPPRLMPFCTACWRGYEGVWAINEGRLELVGLLGTDFDPENPDRMRGPPVDEDGSPITLGDLFPGQTAPVVATWYSGPLVCRLPPAAPGEERRLILEVCEGKVSAERIQSWLAQDPRRPHEYPYLEIPDFLGRNAD